MSDYFQILTEMKFLHFHSYFHNLDQRLFCRQFSCHTARVVSYMNFGPRKS